MHTRRNFLRGAGWLLALPVFETFANVNNNSLATTKDGNPLRIAFVYTPNGVIMDQWRPDNVGNDLILNNTMKPLEHMKQHMQVISGLDHLNGTPGMDGGGDHARALATILTGCRPRKTAGTNIEVGVSVDQIAAKHLKEITRFNSLELSCENVRQSGICDSGYSCAYQYNMSWRSANQPATPESNPRRVFERLFGNGNAAMEQARQSSLLDFLIDDAKDLSKQLSKPDQHKLDEYLTGVRELEERMKSAATFGAPTAPGAKPEDLAPANHQEHIRLLMDMMTLAFQTDSTRISTLLMAHDGSNRSFANIGVTSGHHELSHHQEDSIKKESIAKIDTFYVSQFAYLLDKLNNIKESNGKTILDNSMIVYCSGLSDANKHSHVNLPVILAGRGGGLLKTNQHLQANNVPMTNLYMSLLDKMGISVTRIGDSSDYLKGV
jgi:hypothetical protein